MAKLLTMLIVLTFLGCGSEQPELKIGDKWVIQTSDYRTIANDLEFKKIVDFGEKWVLFSGYTTKPYLIKEVKFIEKIECKEICKRCD